MSISIRKLNKVYPNGNHALKDVCLEIPTGMFGLLGPNGAGKSTLMRILVALMEPTSGEVNICGYDLMRQRKEIRGVLGYLPQDFRFFAKYKTYEFLDYAARLSGMNCKSLRKNAVDEMLENVGLFDVRDRYANKLSGGMKRRLGIAQALIHHPKALPQAVPNSFAEWMNATDYEFVITHPEGYELDPRFVGNARVEYDQKKAFEGADFIYAKNWAAYADPNYGKVLNTDRSWTVNTEKMALTNNAYFMHCLPVRRNMIVTDDVIESPQSIVIPEAANREISAQTVLKKILTSLLPGD